MSTKFGRDRDLYVMKRALRIIRKEVSDLGLIHTNGNIDTKYRSQLSDVVTHLQTGTAKLNDILGQIELAKKKKQWW